MTEKKQTTRMHGALSRALEVQRWIKSYKRWRFMALFLLLSVILFCIYHMCNQPSKTDYIVKLQLKDEIMDMDQVRKAYALLDDPYVKGVLILADSPGGLPAVSEAWAQLFTRLQKKNIPVVALTEDVCASGCYLAIMGADKIFSYNSSIVGSIGAVMAYPNIYNILKKIDLQFSVIKSGPLKAEPSLYSEPRPEYTEETQKIVQDIGHWFVQRVIKIRRLHDVKIQTIIAQGGIFTAQQAQKYGLIDDVGDEIMALDYVRTVLKDPQMRFEVFSLDDNTWWSNILKKYSMMVHMHAHALPTVTLRR